jgi:hypothetical protein
MYKQEMSTRDIIFGKLSLIDNVPKKKLPVTIKVAEEKEQVVSVSKYMRAINIKAHVQRDGYANFLASYHKGSKHLAEDYFYKLLSAKCDKYKELFTDKDVTYKIPYDNDGFKFNTKCTKYEDLLGKPCTAGDCNGKDCLLTLSCIPYEIKKETPQIVGIYIRVLKCKIIPE